MRTRLRLKPVHITLVLCSALLPWLAPSVGADNPPVQPAPPVAAAAYIDQLIDPAFADDATADAWQTGAPELQGRRFYSVEYKHYQERQNADDLIENGVQVNWHRETLDYGEFQLEAAGYQGDNERLNFDNSGGGRFTLNQYGFVVDENRVMDNTLGVLRSSTDPMITSNEMCVRTSTYR